MAATNIAELRQRAKAPVNQKGGGKTLADYFDVNKASIQKALPQHVSADRMLRIALQAVRTTPGLQQCTIESLFGAVVQCSTLGLEPNDTRGLAYLVPFWNNKKRQKECQMIVGYRGFIDLAKRGGNVAHIVGRVVREHDELEITQGTEEKLIHRPYMGGDRGEIVGAYAVAQMRDDDPPLFYFMPWADLEATREGSAGAWYFDKKAREHKPKLDSPWWAHTEAMCAKTAVRRIAKWLPMSIELADAVALDDKADTGEPQNMGGVLDGEYSLVDPEQPQGSADPEPEDARPETKKEAPGDTEQVEQTAEPTEEEALAAQLVADIKATDDPDEVRAMLEQAEVELSGAHKAKVTRAGNARLEQIGGSDAGGNPLE